MSIFVSSPRSYKDVFDVFYFCYNHWWSNSPYPLILATNYDAKYNGIIVINSNNEQDSWVNRTISSLLQIDCEYILLLCDDLFIKNYVQISYIEHILDIMDKNNFNYCSFIPSGKKNNIPGEKYLSYLNKRHPYGRNLQRGIFRRDYLLKLLGNGELSAWDLEKCWLSDTFLAANECFNKDIITNIDVIPVYHGIQKGRWFPSVKYRLKKNGICINGDRETMPILYEIINVLREKMIYVIKPYIRYKFKKIIRL